MSEPSLRYVCKEKIRPSLNRRKPRKFNLFNAPRWNNVEVDVWEAGLSAAIVVRLLQGDFVSIMKNVHNEGECRSQSVVAIGRGSIIWIPGFLSSKVGDQPVLHPIYLGHQGLASDPGRRCVQSSIDIIPTSYPNPNFHMTVMGDWKLLCSQNGHIGRDGYQKRGSVSRSFMLTIATSGQ
jgi:hypothetical protein